MSTDDETRPYTGRLAITLGDPTGIGPEIVSRFLRARRWAETGEGTTPLLIGDRQFLDEDLQAAVRPVERGEDLAALPSNAAAIWTPSRPCEGPIQPGTVSAIAGRACHAWLESAIDLAMEGWVDGIVTAPIHKGAWHAAAIDQPGHTEVLRDRSRVPQVLMMLVGRDLRVALATVHVPLMTVGARLTRDGLVRDLALLRSELKRWFPLDGEPQVAVCGLNPHAGEGGLLGSEDEAVIAPAVHAAQKAGVHAVGPLPADACIPAAAAGAYDAVLAMYHDQALPTVKALAPRSAVNITLGLPFVRTSVDHGTAHDIAGRDLATDDSLASAWNLAKTMAQRAAKLNPVRPPSDLTS